VFELLPVPRRIVLGAAPDLLSESLERRVEANWQEACRRPGLLYNGSLVSVVEVADGEVTVRPSEYRLLVAARREPALRQALAVRPLAVSGLVRLAAGVVLGRRADEVSYAAGVWELVPSGGIEPSDAAEGEIDARSRLLAELEEEIHVTPERVVSAEPFALIHDTREELFDIAFDITIDLEPDDLLEAFERSERREYSAIEVVAESDLAAWASSGRSLLPVSRLLLESRGMLAGQEPAERPGTSDG